MPAAIQGKVLFLALVGRAIQAMALTQTNPKTIFKVENLTRILKMALDMKIAVANVQQGTTLLMQQATGL
jgi:hypothetical protein